MGHSWATLVALELALLDSSAVRKLVLVSGYYFPTARLDIAMAAPPAIPVIGDVMRYTVSPLFARLLLKRTIRKMFAPESVPAGYLHAVPRELLVRPSQIRASTEDAVFMIPAAMRLRKRIASIDTPVTLIAGEDDKVIDPAKQTLHLHHAMPASQLLLLPGAGHMLHHAHHQRVAEAISS
jgi:pimeloyl-ACP methyl ester carboxylesterase